MTEFLSADYWQNRYQEGTSGWDVGEVTPAFISILSKYSKQKETITILIPGAGNAYEAEYAWKEGFQNITIIDWASEPLQNFARRNPEFPKNKLIQTDFFQHQGKYDLILEQTFFCALPPSMRLDYVRKMKELLSENGSLEGLLFNVEMPDGPPFGGYIQEYKRLFYQEFKSVKIQPTNLSIPPRNGREVLIELRH